MSEQEIKYQSKVNISEQSLKAELYGILSEYSKNDECIFDCDFAYVVKDIIDLLKTKAILK